MSKFLFLLFVKGVLATEVGVLAPEGANLFIILVICGLLFWAARLIWKGVSLYNLNLAVQSRRVIRVEAEDTLFNDLEVLPRSNFQQFLRSRKALSPLDVAAIRVPFTLARDSVSLRRLGDKKSKTSDYSLQFTFDSVVPAVVQIFGNVDVEALKRRSERIEKEGDRMSDPSSSSYSSFSLARSFFGAQQRYAVVDEGERGKEKDMTTLETPSIFFGTRQKYATNVDDSLVSSDSGIIESKDSEIIVVKNGDKDDDFDEDAGYRYSSNQKARFISMKPFFKMDEFGCASALCHVDTGMGQKIDTVQIGMMSENWIQRLVPQQVVDSSDDSSDGEEYVSSEDDTTRILASESVVSRKSARSANNHERVAAAAAAEERVSSAASVPTDSNNTALVLNKSSKVEQQKQQPRQKTEETAVSLPASLSPPNGPIWPLLIVIRCVSNPGNSPERQIADSLITVVDFTLTDEGPRAYVSKQVVACASKLHQVKEMYGLDDQNPSPECIICLNEPKDTVLLPCRHYSVCFTCLSQLRRCPVCRSNFSAYLRFKLQAKKEDSNHESV